MCQSPSIASSILTTLALSLAAVLPTAAYAGGPDDVVIVTPPPSPPNWFSAPDYVVVRGISYAGSGCPAGSLSENISLDYRGLSVIMDSFVAEIGPDIPLSMNRKNCQVMVDLDYPDGWQYS